jgi:hypothetical protein
MAQQLKSKLRGDEAQEIQAGGTRNAEAHDAYLLGMHLYWQGAYEAALAQFDRAISFDPKVSGPVGSPVRSAA